MGSELAIDTYILLGVFAWVFAQYFPKRETVRNVIDGPRVEQTIRHLNTGLVVLVGCLLVAGLTVGVTRYLTLPRPEWMDAFPAVFLLAGFTVGFSLLRLVVCWVPLFRDPLPHRLFRHDPRWDRLNGSRPEIPAKAPRELVGAERAS
jgi:hypothetical protein